MSSPAILSKFHGAFQKAFIRHMSVAVARLTQTTCAT